MTYSKQSTGTGYLRQPAGSFLTLLEIRSFSLNTRSLTCYLRSSQRCLQNIRVFSDVTPSRLENLLTFPENLLSPYSGPKCVGGPQDKERQCLKNFASTSNETDVEEF
jgi:hypothetical protein